MTDPHPTPPAEPRVEPIRTPFNNGIPNHPRWPALACRGATGGGVDALRTLFAENGWSGIWDWSVYDFHHYHPVNHEVLGVAAGTATLHLGGPDGPQVEVISGDVLILPAGFGHKRIAASDDFRVVGAYPPGQESPEIVRADDETARAALPRIEALPRPDTDPIHGDGGPIFEHWT